MTLTSTTSFKSTDGLRRIFNAMRYSIAGLLSACKHEAAFRQELALCAVLIPLSAVLPVGVTEHLLLIGCLFVVLITELLNSALEAIVDRVTCEYDELAKRAKDMGSAAVLMSLLLCALVWIGVVFDMLTKDHA